MESRDNEISEKIKKLCFEVKMFNLSISTRWKVENEQNDFDFILKTGI